MKESIIVLCILFTIRFLVIKFSSFRRTHGYNRILKKEYLKNNENNIDI